VKLTAAMSEAEWQAQVLDAAVRFGWRAYHTHDSRRSAAGFPDLVLVHPRAGIIFAELKTDKGRVAAPQAEWLDALQAAAGQHPTRVVLWRPHDASAVWQTLAVARYPAWTDRQEDEL